MKHSMQIDRCRRNAMLPMNPTPGLYLADAMQCNNATVCQKCKEGSMRKKGNGMVCLVKPREMKGNKKK